MFNYLSEVGKQLRAEMVDVYWILLVPLALVLIVLELLNDENPNIKELFRRIIVSVILLYTFDYTVSVIAMVSEGITSRIDGIQKLWDVLKNLGPNYQNASGNFFNLRETALYFFGIAAYIIAYLGFFISTALIHFVWTVLYICSPLMILAYVCKATSGVTSSLYKGLLQVMVWQILWSILGVLLLKLALNPEITGMEDYLMSIIVNLSIGLSMLFIPVASKSLLNDGMQSVASAIAAVPAMATGAYLKAQAMKLAQKGAQGAQFLAKPLTNPIAGNAELLKRRIAPTVRQGMQKYSELGLPSQLKKTKPKEEIKK